MVHGYFDKGKMCRKQENMSFDNFEREILGIDWDI
jgi:hypothetical protein